MADELSQSLEAQLGSMEIDLTIGDEKPKAPSWSNKPLVLDMQQAVLQAREDRDEHVSNVQRWEKATIAINPHTQSSPSNNVTATIKNPFGSPSATKQGKANKSRIQPKLIRKQLEWRVTSLSEPLLAERDLVKANPRTFADVETARQSGLLLNYQFNEQVDRIKFTNEYVRTCARKGTVIVKVSWLSEKKKVHKQTPMYEMRELQQADKGYLLKLQELVDAEQQFPEHFYSAVPLQWQEAVHQTVQTGKPVAPHIVGWGEVTSVDKAENRPVLEFTDGSDFWLDPMARGYIHEARYCVHRFNKSLPELEATGLYFDLDKIKSGDYIAETNWDDTGERAEPTNIMEKQLGKRVTVYEYIGLWDISGKGDFQPIVCSFVNDVIIRMELSPYPDNLLPFAAVPYMPVPGSMYGEPDAELIEDNQKIIGATTRGIVDLMAKTVSGQVGIRQDALDPVNQRRFLMGQKYFFNPAMGDPQTNIYTHRYPEIPQSAPALIAMQTQEAEEMTGIRPYAGPTNIKQNTRAMNQNKTPLDAASKRETDILRRLVDGLEQIFKIMMAFNKEFLTDDEVVRITDTEFVDIRRERLQGSVDLKIEVVTPEEKAARASEIAFMLQTLGQTTDQETRNHLLGQIADLRHMPELAKTLRAINPKPTPQEQQEMQQSAEQHQLEMQLLQAKIANEQSKAQQGSATANLNQAKVGTEQAKARVLDSQADLHDQDFVSKSSTDQAGSQMALRQAQSEGNIHLEKVKHELSERAKDNDLQREYARSTINNMLNPNQ